VVNQIRRLEKQLESWAALAPDSYRAKHLLVSAELARVEERWLEADVRYEGPSRRRLGPRCSSTRPWATSCTAASAGGSSAGEPHLAADLRGRALFRWGARAKVQRCRKSSPSSQRPSLPPPPLAGRPARSVRRRARSPERLPRGGGHLRRGEARSDAGYPDAGLPHHRRGRARSPPARGQQELFVRAVRPRVSPPPCNDPLRAAGDVPATVIEQVCRTGEPLVLGDA
jgi:hypothetical protein